MNPAVTYCRLCARQQRVSEIVDIAMDYMARLEIIEKLSIFSRNPVDFSDKSLPETICMGCLDILRRSSEFIAEVQNAQGVLCTLESVRNFKEIQSTSAIALEEAAKPYVLAIKTEYEIEPKDLPSVCNAVSSSDDDHDEEDVPSKTPRNKNGLFLQNISTKEQDTSGELTPNEDHEADDTYQCTPCGQSFKTWKELQHHTSTDTDPVHKKRRKATIEELTCDICDKIFNMPSRLKYHKVTHTVRSRDYICDVCGKGFFSHRCLYAHKRSNHNSNPQTCEICKRTFLNLTRLKKHVKSHNNAKPFECDECHSTFRSKASIQTHMLIHSDTYLYNCKHCDKSFRYKSALKIHENIHTGMKPFACSECGMDFSNRSNCNKHMLRKHKLALAKRAKTSYGMMPINKETGKPKEFDVDIIKDWSEQIRKPKTKVKKVVTK